jgi:hypothetical protein
MAAAGHPAAYGGLEIVDGEIRAKDVGKDFALGAIEEGVEDGRGEAEAAAQGVEEIEDRRVGAARGEGAGATRGERQGGGEDAVLEEIDWRGVAVLGGGEAGGGGGSEGEEDQRARTA